MALSLLQAAWNGSVSHDWGNRITRYRDTVTEDYPALINGAFNAIRTDNVKVNKYTSLTDAGTLVRLVVMEDAPGFESHESFSVQLLRVLWKACVGSVWVLSGYAGSLPPN